MTPTISTTALGRRYRDQIALDNVSLTIEPGTVTGLLENDRVLRRMFFAREEQPYPDFQVRHAIEAASWFYPN